jgi:hypothetical protein
VVDVDPTGCELRESTAGCDSREEELLGDTKADDVVVNASRAVNAKRMGLVVNIIFLFKSYYSA